MADVMWQTPEDYRQAWKTSCWAAVLHTFCVGTPGRPRLTEQEIADTYDPEDNRTYTFEDGSIKPDGLRRMVQEARFGMKSEYWDAPVFSSKPDYLAQKLGSGWVILGYYEPKIAGGHVALVYGVKNSKVYYLNPDNINGGLLTDDISYFKQNLNSGSIVVCWRAW